MRINSNVLARLVGGIRTAVPGKVSQIILYGSVARGEATEESDIDVAVIVREPLNAEDEERLSDFIVDMNLDYDTVFSVVDIGQDIYTKWKDTSPFYRNVNTEGVILWTAA